MVSVAVMFGCDEEESATTVTSLAPKPVAEAEEPEESPQEPAKPKEPDAIPATAESVGITNEAMQGGILFGRTVPGTKIWLRRQKLRVDDEGNFVLSFGPNHPAEATVRLTDPDGVKRVLVLPVAKRVFAKEDIKVKDSELSKAEKKNLAIWRRRIKKVRQRNLKDSHFLSGFEWPAKGKITGVYGTFRTFNGEKPQRHWGVDIANKTGAKVVAPATGKVVLVATEELPLSGKMLIINHGHALTSTFLHLDSISVKKGDMVEKGDVVAKLGNTGRSTGAHLDWRMNHFKTRVDPTTLVPSRPGADPIFPTEEGVEAVE